MSAGNTVTEAYQPVLDFAKQQLEAKTERKSMSTAPYDFALQLLASMDIKVVVDDPNTERGSIEDPTPYSWTFETKENEKIVKGEHQGTPGAINWFHENFLKNSDFCLKDVTGKKLPQLTANKMSATGKGDVVIGIKEHLNVAAVNPHEHAYGLIELKTVKYGLKSAQNILELAALAIISNKKKKVALLASDCVTKWELCYFEDSITIQRRSYAHSGKCWDDFKKLLDDADTRVLEQPTSRYNQPLHVVEEGDEQNLDGFEGVVEDSKDEAVERQAKLENLANLLAVMYEERPSVPIWARAESTCPEYYS